MKFDLAITETNNGGDLVLLTNDLAVVNNIENQIYLALFGGNVEQSTTTTITNDNLDWWANNLLLKAQPILQLNSSTERTLINTPLTSSGRIIIENAIKEDLAFLNIIYINVEIVATDRIDVNLKIASIDFDSDIVIYFSIKKNSGGSFDLLDFNSDFD